MQVRPMAQGADPGVQKAPCLSAQLPVVFPIGLMHSPLRHCELSVQ